jgi:hypothetical protein
MSFDHQLHTGLALVAIGDKAVGKLGFGWKTLGAVEPNGR